MENICICAKTSIKELYIQVFWLQYSVHVNKFHTHPLLPMMSWSRYACVYLYFQQSCACIWSESLGDHFWFLYFFMPALLNTIQACFPTLLCSAQVLIARNTAAANTYCCLPSTAFPGTKCKSAKCKFIGRDSTVKAAGWLFICQKERPTRKNSFSVAGPQLVSALWRHAICSWKILLI